VQQKRAVFRAALSLGSISLHVVINNDPFDQRLHDYIISDGHNRTVQLLSETSLLFFQVNPDCRRSSFYRQTQENGSA
jgi:hypothetical protein